AQKMLDRIVKENRFQVKAIYGFYPTRVNQEEVALFDEKNQPVAHFEFLRQQKEKVGEPIYYSLADYAQDLIGAFCVTAGSSVEAFAVTFLKDQDDYSSILVKALGDRIAEATAEWLHAKVRAELNRANQLPEEKLPIDEILKEKYPGIRP